MAAIGLLCRLILVLIMAGEKIWMASHVVNSSKLLGTNCVCMVCGSREACNHLNSFLRVSGVCAGCAR